MARVVIRGRGPVIVGRNRTICVWLESRHGFQIGSTARLVVVSDSSRKGVVDY